MNNLRLISLMIICSISLAFPRERVVQNGTTITGACLFGTTWGISFLAGAMVASEESSSDRGGIMTVAIPVLGPIIFSAKYGYQADNNPLIWAIYLGISAAQTTGIALFTRGLIGDTPKPISIRPLYKNGSLGLMCNYVF
jgi:hypothetical protein